MSREVYTNRVDQRKFREAVVYCCSQCSDSKSWGLVKLMKILFYADFVAYEELGHAITGATYVKLPQGPVPTESKPLQDRMVEERDIALEIRKVIDFTEVRPVAVREPNLEVFSPQEVSILDRMISWIKPMTAKQISTHSHDHPGWKMVKMNEQIPYSSALLTSRTDRKLSVETIREVLSSYGDLQG